MGHKALVALTIREQRRWGTCETNRNSHRIFCKDCLCYSGRPSSSNLYCLSCFDCPRHGPRALRCEGRAAGIVLTDLAAALVLTDLALALIDLALTDLALTDLAAAIVLTYLASMTLCSKHH